MGRCSYHKLSEIVRVSTFLSICIINNLFGHLGMFSQSTKKSPSWSRNGSSKRYRRWSKTLNWLLAAQMFVSRGSYPLSGWMSLNKQEERSISLWRWEVTGQFCGHPNSFTLLTFHQSFLLGKDLWATSVISNSNTTRASWTESILIWQRRGACSTWTQDFD